MIDDKQWEELSARLKEPFPPADISWRVGTTNKKAWEKDNTKPKKGIPLAYIDARDVMNRLDEVVGPGNWEDSYKDVLGRIVCTLTIYGVSKSDGAGDTDMEGEKGGMSDAFKRAAVKWGIGRYLYDIKAGWIALDDYWGIPAAGMMQLTHLLSKTKPTPGLPSDAAMKEDLKERPFTENPITHEEAMKALDLVETREQWDKIAERVRAAWAIYNNHQKGEIKAKQQGVLAVINAKEGK